MLENATDLINRDRNRNYEDDVDAGLIASVPSGITSAAYRIATNMYIRMVWNQHAQGVSNENFDTSKLSSEAFTADIARDLAPYPAKPRFGFRRMRNKTQIEEDAAII